MASSSSSNMCDDLTSDIRWRILPVMCLLCFGGYWNYDSPSAYGTGPSNTIQARFAAHGKEYTNEMNQALYSIYSWPNTVIATFGGILVDSILGLRKSLVLFVSLVTLGAFIFWIGVSATSYPGLLLGRFIFGLGSEAMGVAQNSLAARYFSKKGGMALAIGIGLFVSHMGSALNFVVSPVLAEKSSVALSALFGFFACVASAVATAAAIVLDIRAERNGLVVPFANRRRGGTVAESAAGAEGEFGKDGGAGGGRCLSFRASLRALPRRYWMLSALISVMYLAVFPFVGIAKNLMEVQYRSDGRQSSAWAGMYQFSAAIFCPLMGAVIDTAGRPALWILASGAGLAFMHLLFLVSAPPPAFMMIVLGLVYATLASSLWPSVPFVVPPSHVGLAYGVAMSLQNSGLTVYPLIIGAILDADTPPSPTPIGLCANFTAGGFNQSSASSYPPLSLVNCTNTTHLSLPGIAGFHAASAMFMVTALCGVCVAVALIAMDRSMDRVLSVPAAERAVVLARQLALWHEDECGSAASGGGDDGGDDMRVVSTNTRSVERDDTRLFDDAAQLALS